MLKSIRNDERTITESFTRLYLEEIEEKSCHNFMRNIPFLLIQIYVTDEDPPRAMENKVFQPELLQEILPSIEPALHKMPNSMIKHLFSEARNPDVMKIWKQKLEIKSAEPLKLLDPETLLLRYNMNEERLKRLSV